MPPFRVAFLTLTPYNEVWNREVSTTSFLAHNRGNHFGQPATVKGGKSHTERGVFLYSKALVFDSRPSSQQCRSDRSRVAFQPGYAAVRQHLRTQWSWEKRDSCGHQGPHPRRSSDERRALPKRSGQTEPSPAPDHDDCQELLGKPRRMVMFRSALDRRVRGGCPTMLSFTCNQVPKNDFVVIPQSKRWAKYVIDSPDLEERFQLINHVAKQEQMELSPVLCQLLAKWLGGTGRGILGALHRLKLEQTSWTNSRDALRACGILDAYLGGDPQWDLRHRVIRTAKACEPMFPHIDCRAMACYTLIRTATLCEHSVAQFLSQSPGSCYSEASCFAELRRSDPAVAQAHHQFVELVLDRLLR